jgi:hypothetical protein
LGLSVRTAQAGRHDRTSARGDQSAVPRDHQRSGRAVAEGHERQRLEQFKQKVMTVDPGAKGQSSTPDDAFVPLLLLSA